MDAGELARWTRFAAKGGIGKCTATQDCVAQRAEDLMFLKDDEVTVLMQLPEQDGLYLGYCEGVVGRFQGVHVRFHSKLKKPIMTKRSSTSNSSFSKASSSSPSPSIPSEVSALRVLVSSPPPLVITPVLPQLPQEVIQQQQQPYSPSQPSPEDETAAGPSNSYSSTSSASDSALDTPPITVGFDHSALQRDSKPLTLLPIVTDDDIQPESQEVTPRPTSICDSVASVYDDDDDEPNNRMSPSLSDGEVGIGLSLLQDFAGGSGDGDDWSDSSESDGGGPRRSESKTPDLKSPHRDASELVAEGHSIVPTVERLPAAAPPATVVARTSDARPVSQARPSSRSVSSVVSSRVSTQRSHSDQGEDWEGASDIYENYRYSRFSMNSKMSSYSQGSTSTASEVPPPPLPRQSTDSQSQYSILSQSPTTPNLIIPPHTQSNPINQPPPNIPTGGSRKDRPPSLKLSAAPVTSPLLHASFGSPITSPRAQSGSSSLLSPALSGPSPSPTFGVASSLRSKLESERGSPVLPSPIETRTSEEHRPTGIVIEDDEDAPDISVGITTTTNTATTTTETQDESFVSESTDQETVQGHSELGRSQSSGGGGPPPLQIPSQASNSSSGNPPLSPLSSFPLPPQEPQLRPVAMSEFLGAQRANGGSTKRTSLFLPHPNAPKPSNTPSGPMYARPPSATHSIPRGASPAALSSPNNIPGGSTIRVLQQAAAARFTPNGQLRRTTIYGRCEIDLIRSEGPVPIVFSMDPPPATPPLPPSPLGMGAKRSPSPAKIPIVSSPLTRNEFSSSASSPQMLSAPPGDNGQQMPAGNVIMRPGFFPQAKGVRPRSRSFSGFNSPGSDVPGRAREVGQSQSASVQTSFGRKPSLSVLLPQPHANQAQSVPVPSPTPSSDQGVTSPTLNSRSPHPPSPLSMPHNDSSLSSSLRSSIMSPSSPLSPVLSPSSYNTSPPMSSSPARQGFNKLRKAASSTAIHNEAGPSSPLGPTPPLRIPKRNMSFANSESSKPSPTSSLPRRNTSVLQESPNPSSTPPSIPPTPSIPRASRSTMQESSPSQTWNFSRRKGSVGTISSQDSDLRVASPPLNGSAVTRTSSLRKKLSLPSLRAKSIQLTRPDDSANSSNNNGQDNEMVQAENIEFELIRPSMSQAPGRTSEESAFMPREQASMQLEGRPNITGHLRADSPAVSTVSGASSAPRSPTGESLKTPKSSDAESSMDAHRQRELKWVSLISSVPAAQAKKNKKVKKLLLEGVPSSVRYLVWAHLMDSKARGMPGLYSQLGKRGKVPAFDDIERDAQRCYPEQPQLHTAQGTLVALLQSYLTMVPDIQYEIGLTYIAGRLLILAPDEDAFWIFVSLMDTYLRPWFSVNTIQMEVDASLFSKALETNDGHVAKKLYVDLGISQTAVCRPWFASLFAQSLPVEYLNRVWDIFLYEGVAFLFRVGLALIHCCRHYLLQSDGEASALDHLVRPPPSCLPATSDAFITLAYSFKLKDDDVRKQRIKMEAQVKRQTQMRVLSVPGLAGAKAGSAISLPKA